MAEEQPSPNKNNAVREAQDISASSSSVDKELSNTKGFQAKILEALKIINPEMREKISIMEKRKLPMSNPFAMDIERTSEETSDNPIELFLETNINETDLRLKNLQDKLNSLLARKKGKSKNSKEKEELKKEISILQLRKNAGEKILHRLRYLDKSKEKNCALASKTLEALLSHYTSKVEEACAKAYQDCSKDSENFTNITTENYWNLHDAIESRILLPIKEGEVVRSGAQSDLKENSVKAIDEPNIIKNNPDDMTKLNLNKTLNTFKAENGSNSEPDVTQSPDEKTQGGARPNLFLNENVHPSSTRVDLAKHRKNRLVVETKDKIVSIVDRICVNMFNNALKVLNALQPEQLEYALLETLTIGCNINTIRYVDIRDGNTKQFDLEALNKTFFLRYSYLGNKYEKLVNKFENLKDLGDADKQMIDDIRNEIKLLLLICNRYEAEKREWKEEKDQIARKLQAEWENKIKTGVTHDENTANQTSMSSRERSYERQEIKRLKSEIFQLKKQLDARNEEHDLHCKERKKLADDYEKLLNENEVDSNKYLRLKKDAMEMRETLSVVTEQFEKSFHINRDLELENRTLEAEIGKQNQKETDEKTVMVKLQDNIEPKKSLKEELSSKDPGTMEESMAACEDVKGHSQEQTDDDSKSTCSREQNNCSNCHKLNRQLVDERELYEMNFRRQAQLYSDQCNTVTQHLIAKLCGHVAALDRVKADHKNYQRLAKEHIEEIEAEKLSLCNEKATFDNRIRELQDHHISAIAEITKQYEDARDLAEIDPIYFLKMKGLLIDIEVFVKLTLRTDLSCGICQEVVVTPVVSRCGHIFCMACLHRSMISDPSCPLCSQIIVESPGRSQLINKIVVHLLLYRDEIQNILKGIARSN